MLFEVLTKDYPHIIYPVYKIEYREDSNDTQFFMYDRSSGTWFWDNCINYEPLDKFNNYDLLKDKK